jgi:hypothetical protein
VRCSQRTDVDDRNLHARFALNLCYSCRPALKPAKRPTVTLQLRHVNGKRCYVLLRKGRIWRHNNPGNNPDFLLEEF